MTASQTMCRHHPDLPADSVCDRCGDELCHECQSALSSGIYCAGCRRRVRYYGIATGLAVALFASLFFLPPGILTDRLPGTVQDSLPRFYGSETTRIGALKAAVRRDPCDGNAAHELITRLRSATALREAIRRADKYLASCDDFPSIRREKVEALRALGRSQEAILELGHLIETDPFEKEYWLARAETLAGMRAWASAAADYRQALALDPKLPGVAARLTKAVEQLGAPGTTSLSLQGSAVVDYMPGAAVAPADASMDGKAVRLDIDATAGHVVVSRATAAKLGIADATGGPEAWVATANGLVKGTLARISRVELQRLAAKDVDIVVAELGDSDGILGMTFLSLFEVRNFPRRGKLILRAANAPAIVAD